MKHLNKTIPLLYFLILGSHAQQTKSERYIDSIYQVLRIQHDSIKQEIQTENYTYHSLNPPAYDTSIESYSVEDVPSPRGKNLLGYVVDPKDVLSGNEERRINELLYRLEEETTAEAAVVFLPSIGNEVPKDFAVALFNTWKMGKASTDNGLLILTIMDQRRTEFEVGYGLEPVLTDALCYRIGVNEIVPNFKRGLYGQGIEDAVLRIKEFLEDPETIDEIYGYAIPLEDHPQVRWEWYHYLLTFYGIICLVLGLIYFGQAFAIERSKDDFYDKHQRLHKLQTGCLQFFFPFPLAFFFAMTKRRLNKYRNAPRFSKVNGKPMKLLDNYDEIDYLEEIQLIEEDIQTKLYDVWVTDDRSDILILEYQGPNHWKYKKCKECGYKTFGKKHSMVKVIPTTSTKGLRIDYYECKNCNYLEKKEVELAMKPSSSSSASSSFGSNSSSSSSSSSFGGGSSGGGGAGVSW